MSEIVRRMIADNVPAPERKTPEWDALCARISAELGRAICAAKKTNQPWPCEAIPVGGRKRCRMHGGKTPRAGVGHPSFKTGKFSTALKGTSLEALYAKAIGDPNLLQLEDEIAVLSAYGEQLLAGLSRGECAATWARCVSYVERLSYLMRDLLERLDVVDAEPQHVAVRAQLEELETLARQGVGDRAVLREYELLTEQIRKLKDTERKYREGLQLYVPSERLEVIFSLLIRAAKDTIPPEHVRPFIEAVERNRLATAPAPGGGRADLKIA